MIYLHQIIILFSRQLLASMTIKWANTFKEENCHLIQRVKAQCNRNYNLIKCWKLLMFIKCTYSWRTNSKIAYTNWSYAVDLLPKEVEQNTYCCKIFIDAQIIWMFINMPTFLCKPQSSHSFMVLEEIFSVRKNENAPIKQWTKIWTHIGHQVWTIW